MTSLLKVVPMLIFAGAACEAAPYHPPHSEVVGGYRWYYVVIDGGAYLDSETDSEGWCISCAQPNSSGVTLTVPDRLGGYPVVSATTAAFNTCKAGKIVMPRYMTSLGEEALLYLPNLSELDLSNTQIETLGYHAICPLNAGLSVVRTPKTLRKIAYGACDSPYRVQFHVPSLDDWCAVQFGSGGERSYYSGTEGISVYVNGAPVVDLSSVRTATSIGDGAFGCQSTLLSGVIPPTVTNVGHRAFQNCSKMTNVVFSTPAVVGKYAFADCTRIGTAEFPDGMRPIGDYAFQSCSSLSNVVFRGSCGRLGSGLFSGCQKLVSIRLPTGLAAIPSSLFSNCGTLPSVELPEDVASIGVSAFYGCRSLGDINLPSGLESVGASAFEGCTNLTTVTMPARVASVGYRLFARDVGLREVRWLGACPQLGTSTNLYADANPALVSRVPADETWIPHLRRGTWCGRRIMTEGGPWYVTFDLTDRGSRTGGGAIAQTVPSEGAATPPTVVSTDEDYEFAGWDRPCDYFGYDATVTAVFRPKPIQRKSSETVCTMRFATNEVALAALGGVKPYVWALAPETPLPEGYVLTADGVVVAAKTAAFLGETDFRVLVADSVGMTNTLSFTLSVSENTDAKPVVTERLPVRADPVASERAARTFSVTAGDPEGGTLNYRWLVDGEERQSGSDPSFAYVVPTGGAAAHALVCQVEDDVWKGVWTTAVEWNVRTLLPPATDPPSGTVFEGGSGQVAVTCSVAEATIYVGRKGFAPHLDESFRYTGPITLTKSETLVYQAVCDGVASPYGTARFFCATPEYASAVGADAEVTFETGGDAAWTVIADPTAPDGTTSLRSGTVGLEQSSVLTASFAGSGTFSFRWKVDCEEDPGGACSWDALLVYVDDEELPRAAIDGTTDWRSFSISFDSDGDHSVSWVFTKDDYDEEPIPYADCGWIDRVRWVSEPFPELPADAGAAEIREILADAADSRLRQHLTTPERYGRFRAWTQRLTAAGGPDAGSVKAHPRSWPSFALDFDGLLSREIADEDLVVRTFAPAATSGRFTLTASVGAWAVGSGARPEDLATIFGVAGTSSLGMQAFSGEGVCVTFESPSGGLLVLSVGSTDAFAPAFFFRLNVK